MVNYEGEFDIIKSVVFQIKKNYEGSSSWKDKNMLEFKNNKKVEGEIKFNNLSIDITGKKIIVLFNKIKKVLEDAEKNKLVEADLARTPLKNLFRNYSYYGEIDKVPDITKKLIKCFNKYNIAEINIGKSFSQNESVKFDLELVIYPTPDGCREELESGYESRLKTFLFDEKLTTEKEKDNISIFNSYKFKSFPKEKIIEIKLKNMLIGHYYIERNLITLYFNPFTTFKSSIFDEDVSIVWKEIFEVFKKLKVHKEDVDKIQEKFFIAEFLKNTGDKLSTIKSDKKAQISQISTYENNIRSAITRYDELCNDEAFIQQTISNKGKGLFQEAKKLNNLPFVEKVKIESGKIDIKFKPTFIPIPKMIRSDSGKNYGKRYMWIGAIGFKISANYFEVYGDVNIAGHCHPHGSSYPQGTPCFGDGDGRNKIYSLLSQNKFYDLGKMLWFWIKTYKNNGAYVKVWNAYDSVLEQGYPILDEKGNRIDINDPDRIKSGEQKKLTKKSNYKENFEKFSNKKLE